MKGIFPNLRNIDFNLEKPRIAGVPLNVQVQVGQKVALGGTISADSQLTNVRVVFGFAYPYNISDIYDINSNTYDLRNCFLDTTDDNLSLIISDNGTGTYPFILTATSVDCPSDEFMSLLPVIVKPAGIETFSNPSAFILDLDRAIFSIIGGPGNDILFSCICDTELYGEDGSDTYVFGKRFGNDTIYDMNGSGDTVAFTDGITPDMVQIQADENTREITITVKHPEREDCDKIHIPIDYGEVEYVRFLDSGLEWNLKPYFDDLREKLNIGNQVNSEEYTKISVQCPVEVEFYTQSGELISRITDTGATVTSSKYGHFHTLPQPNGEVEKVAYLYDKSVKVKIIGTDSGKMDYTVSTVNNIDNTIKTIQYQNVPITSSSIISTEANVQDETPLNISIDNNQTFADIFLPTAIATESIPVLSDNNVVASDKENLSIALTTGDTQEYVRDDIYLKEAGANGSTIAWSSSDGNVITNEGKVFRPVFGSGDKTVTLTAKITKGEATDTI